MAMFRDPFLPIDDREAYCAIGSNERACGMVKTGLSQRLCFGMLLLGGALAFGCGPTRPDERNMSLPERLQSDDEAIRARAAVEAGRSGDSSTVPYLVDLLEDDSANVRLFAIESLRSLTGRDFGYKFYQSGVDRKQAVERWRDWLEREWASPAP